MIFHLLSHHRFLRKSTVLAGLGAVAHDASPWALCLFIKHNRFSVVFLFII